MVAAYEPAKGNLTMTIQEAMPNLQELQMAEATTSDYNGHLSLAAPQIMGR
jgi:hypothetical protein